jgi:hypothetical protein
MSVTRHERDLKELLDTLARADEKIEVPPQVERRVMAYWDAAAGSTSAALDLQRPTSSAWGKEANFETWGRVGMSRVARLAGLSYRHMVPAAVVLAAIVILMITWEAAWRRSADRGDEVSRGAQQPLRLQPPFARSAEALSKPADGPVASAPVSRKGLPRLPAAGLRNEVVEFVPLLPMGEQELSGSWQVVRVRMPRAALADLGVTPDTNRMGDPVQAEVLLGEDGVARAIRVAGASDGFRSQ